MLHYGCRVRVGLKLAASIVAGCGLAAQLGSMSAEAASSKSRHETKGDEIALSRAPGTPVMAIVSLNQQRVTIYDLEGPTHRGPVSTGQSGYETPAGIYSVLEKQAEHYSNLYDDASMPYMQRLTWSGIALHAGVLPGHPASHGCIRMPFGFAERLFERTKLGMRVIVVRDDISPATIVHPALFKPLPGEDAPAGAGLVDAPASTRVADASATAAAAATGQRRSWRAIAAAKSAEAAAAAKKVEETWRAARSANVESVRASKALRRAEVVKSRAEEQLRQAEQLAGGDKAAPSERAQQAKSAAAAAAEAARAQLQLVKAEMQPKVELALQLRQQAKDAEAARVAVAEEAKEAQRKLSPVSVFVSRATQRLYVRQAREPLFETPITIANPERPLGTYVFTALAYEKGESDLRWNVVSMYRTQSGYRTAGERGKDRHAGATPADLDGARIALDRITIPKEANERIAEVVSPGSSLIVSDEGLSKETGKATEFIVLMSTEPQGGIKIRRRSSPPEARYRYQQRSYGGSPFGWNGGGSSFFWW